jgi:raffinose/stachyose/melibiose transport system permease protein
MRIKEIALNVIKYSSLVVASLIAIIPIMVIFFASFKTPMEYSKTGPLVPPESWLNFDNYFKAFKGGNMLLGYANTIIILIIAITGTVLLGTMTAYVLHRFAFKYKKVILLAFLFATLIPGVTTQVATFQIINKLGLFNTRSAMIILSMSTDVIAVYIFLQFLDRISVSLDEAAIIEGASYFRIYWNIILPLLKPAIATVMIIKGVGIYNDFYTPFLYMPKSSLNVISTALFKFKGPFGTQWEVISAGIMIAIIPTLISFLALQKYIYNGFTAGSEK